MANETVALFIPLLLAIVTGLSSFLRENVNLKSAVDKNRPSFPVLLSFLPSLGRFPVIHLSNILLLLIGIRIIKDLATNRQTAIIGAIILSVFLLILPIIEIEPLDEILDEDSRWFSPRSYYYHWLAVIFLSLYFFGFVELQVMVINVFILRGFAISGTAIWLLNQLLEILLFSPLVVGALLLYQSLACLKSEIKQLNHKN
ncbi:hypothetical protein VB773_01595 [Haloarculaceae archaeon H-GB2-1]|nr:hypothetical protein [Haloarculaceae archaeon H-GB1-1]MEA5388365.1 hypothetical protein [Haloarculaceae archaeon H-GB11]MEA5406402.1 hypothetical protein [Haloarculaceae archaeon H-GB2-1]